MRKRNEWDVLKCLATLLVVIGHIMILYKQGGSFPAMENCYLAMLSDVIYLFHMPLFVAISGAVYAIGKQSGKYQDVKSLLMNKAKRLLVPYYFVAYLFLVPTILGLGMNRTGSNIDYFLEIFLGTNCRHLWYLWALFWMFIIIRFCIGKYLGNPTYCLVIAMILSVGCSYWVGADWFSFRMALHYLPFFFLGEWLVVKGENSMKMWKPVALVLLSGCILKLMDIRWMDSLFSLWMNVGIVVVLCLFIRKVSAKSFFSHSFKILILRNSFGVYLFHVPIIYIMVSYFQNYPIYVLLPLVGVTSIMGSIFLTMILRKMKLQCLIGE
ncbi:MAG: acyltransferase [Bacteroides sp.]|nr:acyltransferase [Bacteroides sp.]